MYTLLPIRYTSAIKGYRLQLFNRVELQAKGIMNFDIEHVVSRADLHTSKYYL